VVVQTWTKCSPIGSLTGNRRGKEGGDSQGNGHGIDKDTYRLNIV
jgi:hypothetical protein